MFGQKGLAELLLERGADPGLTDEHRRTAAEHARKEGNAKLAERLERARAATSER